MNRQIEYIGAKIKNSSSEIFQRPEIQMWKSSCSLDESSISWSTAEMIIRQLGELVISQKDQHKNDFLALVDFFGHTLIKSSGSLDQSIQFMNLIRLTILDLLEQELRNSNITINSYFDVTKIIEDLHQQILNSLIHIYNEEMSFMRLELNESKENLKMTLRELAELESVLNEVTLFAITDREDRILYANDKFCQLYQYTKEELLGKKHEIYSSNHHPTSFFNDIWATIQNGEIWRGEILNQAKDGTKHWLDTTIIPFVDANGERYKHISIQYDITEKRNTEETLRKTEKLAMIGELAAGIAHEIRNPLTTIRGFVQLLNENGIDSYFADTILDEIDRINFIVNEFMVFAKPHQIHFSECNLHQILSSVIKFLEPEANLKNVHIENHFAEEELCIPGERNQLKQVFLNLIKNSIEAMPNGGTICTSIVKTEDEISVIIIDQGIGMKLEQIKKLGEPFFTTKQNGNGLGLMVSYKIIQNHKGRIQVDSQLNEGTTFKITFETPRKNQIINEANAV
ncbi:ATP-binding protein [Robertmurraya massiliosenegalensis]|uniref:ATP-binding protein n=1 Tax=Robertmurraya massiliosenegalensis TaxID=1287657 RepID=UPI0002E454B1|nr:ATP-binding protein [Robertmurraya massiliosenegalensis]